MLFSLTVEGNFKTFFQALADELRNGLFFFSSPWDIFVSVLDIGVTAMALYYILKLISETRAWQLLKGLLWLFFFTIIAGWLGLGTVNYLLVNSISVLAVGLVVIFQPELRRALESVGRNSTVFFASREDRPEEGKLLHNVIESIVVACEQMAEECTGALIILERTTQLGDLIESGTAVILNAEITSAAIRQIFYKNSPMHDGAMLIRRGRIYATRVHVPLSDSYQLRREMGTRHRAAIGASEIGDAISIVVSEEHGSISLAVRGRLYTLENADALRTILHRLLSHEENRDASSLPRKLRKVLRFDLMERRLNLQREAVKPVSETTKEALDSIAEDEGESAATIQNLEVTTNPRRSKVFLSVIAVMMAVGFWLFVRVTTNPIINRTFNVPLRTIGTEQLEALHLDYYKAENQVTVTIRGRESTLKEIISSQVDASIDFSAVTKAGTIALPITVQLNNISNLAYQVTWRNPDQVVVNFYQEESVPRTATAGADNAVSTGQTTGAG